MRMIFGVCIALLLGLLASSPVRAGHPEKNIDEIMRASQKEIDSAFSDFSRTKAVSKLAEIERLNENAGGSLIEWLDSANLACCTKEKKEPVVKRTWENDQVKFKFYLKHICNNYTRIAGSYAEKNMSQKALSLYQFVTEAFEGPEFDKCTGEAKTRLTSTGSK